MVKGFKLNKKILSNKIMFNRALFTSTLLKGPADAGYHVVMNEHLNSIASKDIDVRQILMENYAYLISLLLYRVVENYSDKDSNDFGVSLIGIYVLSFEGILESIRKYYDYLRQNEISSCGELFVDNLMLIARVDKKNNTTECATIRLGLLSFINSYIKIVDKIINHLATVDDEHIERVVKKFIEFFAKN